MTAPTQPPPPKRPRGRPPIPKDQHAAPPARSVRLTDVQWAELKRRGVDALRRWLDNPMPPT